MCSPAPTHNRRPLRRGETRDALRELLLGDVQLGEEQLHLSWLRPPVSASWGGAGGFSPVLKTRQKLLGCFLAVVLSQAPLKGHPQVRASPWPGDASALWWLLYSLGAAAAGFSVNKLLYKCSKDRIITAH